MFALLDMSSSSDEDAPNLFDIPLQRDQLRSGVQIIYMPNSEFQKNFRMNKETFLYILSEISPHLKKSHRTTSNSNETKVATTIRFLATGGYQKGIGNEFIVSLAQSKVSNVIQECLTAMEQTLCPKLIKFNTLAEEEVNTKSQFLEKFAIPGVIGCVDGTHIKIMPPKEDVRHLYYNRKGYYSLNVMLICDFNQIITFVDSRYAGANHDAFIWASSAANMHLKHAYQNGKTNTWLLGDGGYQCLPYLLTPYRIPSTEIQKQYNLKLIKARNTIERCIGVLKNRFRCLIQERGLHYGEEKAKTIVNVCCALHNICVHFKNEWPHMDELEEVNEDVSIEQESDISISSAAQRIRYSVAHNLM